MYFCHPHLIFSLQDSRDHRDLHSFPTRRSSDLMDPFDDYTQILSLGLPPLEGMVGPDKTPDFERRSEEHTSELQSLRHLVCRLLLEKKKKPPRHNQHPLSLTRQNSHHKLA